MAEEINGFWEHTFETLWVLILESFIPLIMLGVALSLMYLFVRGMRI